MPQQYAYEQQFAANTAAQQGMQTQSYVSETGRSDRKSKAGNVIYSIVFWIFSVLHIIYALAAFGSKGIVSGIIFLISGLLINPKIDDVIGAKWKKIPVVAIVIVLIVGFIAGMMTFLTGK